MPTPCAGDDAGGGEVDCAGEGVDPEESVVGELEVVSSPVPPCPTPLPEEGSEVPLGEAGAPGRDPPGVESAEPPASPVGLESPPAPGTPAGGSDWPGDGGL